MDLTLINTIRFIAAQTERGFVLNIDLQELDEQIKSHKDPWKGLAATLHGPVLFDKLLKVQRGAWEEYVPVWIQQFIHDAKLLLAWEAYNKAILKVTPGE